MPRNSLSWSIAISSNRSWDLLIDPDLSDEPKTLPVPCPSCLSSVGSKLAPPPPLMPPTRLAIIPTIAAPAMNPRGGAMPNAAVIAVNALSLCFCFDVVACITAAASSATAIIWLRAAKDLAAAVFSANNEPPALDSAPMPDNCALTLPSFTFCCNLSNSIELTVPASRSVSMRFCKSPSPDILPM